MDFGIISFPLSLNKYSTPRPHLQGEHLVEFLRGKNLEKVGGVALRLGP